MTEEKSSVDDIRKTLEGKISDDVAKELMEDVLDMAGDYLTGRMIELFGDDRSAIKWFYSEIISLENVSPYQKCKEGKSKAVEYVLDQLEYGGCA